MHDRGYACVCRECGSDFHRLRRRGYMDWCNRCSGNARVRAWKAANPERNRAINTQPSAEAKRRYAQSEKGRERSREKSRRYFERHPERVRENRRANYAANRDAHIQRVVNRQKRVVWATPQWADHEAIARIYAEARARTKLTGVLHDVDHIIPLKGKEVSGLHVEGNLRVITARENRRKHRRFDPVLNA